MARSAPTGEPRSLLAPRDASPGERAARDDEPRPGVWLGDNLGDGRSLTQVETEILIRAELVASAYLHERSELIRLVGEPRSMTFVVGEAAKPVTARTQRGGIDSDPLVRVLAYRCWRHRDRRWVDARRVQAVHLNRCLCEQFEFEWMKIERDRTRQVTGLLVQHAQWFAALEVRDPERLQGGAGVAMQRCSELKNLTIWPPSGGNRATELQRPPELDAAIGAQPRRMQRVHLERELVPDLFGVAFRHWPPGQRFYMRRMAYALRARRSRL